LVELAREKALAEAQAQRREAELRLSVLAAQVEPHFLFNTLAGVRSAIHGDPARASDMIDHLVAYLRAAIPRLRHDGSAQATVGGQFETLRAYLGLMAARMPRLSWSVQAPEALLAAQCPPLMLISLVENAVKHGVEPKLGPAHIRVSAERTGDGRLALTVEDDGVGFGHSSAGTGLGLANVRERLAQLHGEQASLALRARPEGGVQATLTVPLEGLATPPSPQPGGGDPSTSTSTSP
jgi:LytS/YehU family sensor histidine kinase